MIKITFINLNFSNILLFHPLTLIIDKIVRCSVHYQYTGMYIHRSLKKIVTGIPVLSFFIISTVAV